jgi:hypothetical protein
MSHLYTEILRDIGDATLPDRAVHLLRNSSFTAKKAAVELLAEFPSPDALDELWELRCSLEADPTQLPFTIQVDDALAACVKLSPEWLVKAIRHSNPSQEPFSALVYLLVRLAEIEEGERFWIELKDTVLEKTPAQDRRALFYAIESFRDADALALIADSYHQDEDLVAPAALRVLGLLLPETALAVLDEAPLESSLLFARSWWLIHLLALHYERTSAILLRKIARHENLWLAVAVYDGHQNLITPDLLDLLLRETGVRLDKAAAEPDFKDTFARAFRFLSKVSRLDLLARFEALRGTPFESALTDYLIRQGPNDQGWYRWSVWDGIAILQKVGGDGLTRLANYHLTSARTRLGIRDGMLLGIRRPDDDTIRLVIEISRDPERGGQLENGFPLVQYEATKSLAALRQLHEVVQGCLLLGLQTPRSLPDYLEGQTLTDEHLAPALTELRSGAPSPGALLAIGFSGRPEFAPEIRALFSASEPESERALACLLALESLGDLDSEGLFIESLDSPKYGWVAMRALFGRVSTPRGDEALLHRLKALARGEEGSDRQLLAMNLLIREPTRERAARILWDEVVDRQKLLFYTGDTLEYLATLNRPEVNEFLLETASLDQRDTWYGADRHAAIEGLAKSSPDDAFEAATTLFQSDDSDRLLCPETLLCLREEAALQLFRKTLATTKDFLLIASIGEALDRRPSSAPALVAWLTDPDFKVREGASFAMMSLRWSQELEGLLLLCLEDANWDVRAAAREAFEKLRLSRYTEELAQKVTAEVDLSRRWTLIDSALSIGYPGVVSGYGAHSWFGRMIEGQSYILRKHALTLLEEKRKKLKEELAKRER